MAPVDIRFYDLLQVSPDASDRDIKLAYRKLAVKYHPDKNNGDPEMAEKFKEITAAYEVLSSPEQRARYDEFGDDGGHVTDSTMDSYYHHGFEFYDMFDDERNIQKTLSVTLEELYNGTTKVVNIFRYEVCLNCHGRGYAATARHHPCKKCQGTGTKTITKNVHGVIKKRTVRCFDCNGKGTFFRENDICKECRGEGIANVKKKLDVEIKGGLSDPVIVLEGQGHRFINHTGDVVIQLDVQEHPIFRLYGHDLYVSEKLSFVEALTGFERMIKHLDGRHIVITSPPGTLISPNDIRVVHGEGMPLDEKTKGNLLIEFDVQFPDTPITNPKHIKLLRNMFPMPEPLKYQDDDVTKCVLKEPEIGEIPSEDAYSDHSYYEDDGHVPCAQQ